jgi:hypothetical protein
VTTIVPKFLADPPSDVDRLLPLVPLADVRIVAAKEKSAVADASTTIGITSPIWALLFAILAVVLGLLVLYFATAYRITCKLVPTNNLDAGRICEPFPTAGHHLDIRSGRVGRICNEFVRTTDRDHGGHFNSAWDCGCSGPWR